MASLWLDAGVQRRTAVVVLQGGHREPPLPRWCVGSGPGFDQREVPPLRCAPVGTTNGSGRRAGMAAPWMDAGVHRMVSTCGADCFGFSSQVEAWVTAGGRAVSF